MKYATIIGNEIHLHDAELRWKPAGSTRILNPQVVNDNGFIVITGERLVYDYFYELDAGSEFNEMPAEKAAAIYDPECFRVVERKSVTRKIQWWPFKIKRNFSLERIAIMYCGWQKRKRTQPVELRFAEATIIRES